MARKSKYRCSSTASVTRGQIIPAAVIEEKRRASQHATRTTHQQPPPPPPPTISDTPLDNSCHKCKEITLKIKQSLKWDKLHEWLVRCSLFRACMHLFEEDDDDDEGRVSPHATACQVHFQKVPFTSSIGSFSSNGDFASLNFASSPVSSKQRRRKSAFESIAEEASLSELANGSFTNRKQQTSRFNSNLCAACLASNHDRTLQYLDDTYQCADCAEIQLDVNNNFRKPAAAAGLGNNRLGPLAAHPLASQQPNVNTSSKVTFASLFSDMSNFDQNTGESQNVSEKLEVKRQPEAKVKIQLDENNNEIVALLKSESETCKDKLIPQVKHGPKSEWSQQSHSSTSRDEVYECRSLSVDIDYTTDGDFKEHIYENDDFVYI
jgi:hypothetical protein